MIVKKLTKSPLATKTAGRKLATDILRLPQRKGAIIIGLEGELGSGKTTFLQGLALGFGIKEKILSPTFIIFRKFALGRKKLKNFYHFDCYRIEKEEELLQLGFKEIASDSGNIVAIEWPENIKKILPKNFLKLKFRFIDKNTREINIFYDAKTFSRY